VTRDGRVGREATFRHDGGVPTPISEQLRLRCIEAVAQEGERFGALAHEMSPERLDIQVPWIPAWSVRDLVGHLGTVHRWATAILRAGTTTPPPPEATQRPPQTGLLDWYAEGHAALVDTLRVTPAGAPAWHMSPAAGKTATDWARRQAHELAVHRMDLEAAAGTRRAPLDPALADDGVDELLTIVVPRWAHTQPLCTSTVSVAVTATDTGRTWRVRVDHGGITIGPDREGDETARLRGAATELLLHLWGRPAPVHVSGDPAAEAMLRGR
jgi:uncharacterized protein (TIGR03083 family)